MLKLTILFTCVVALVSSKSFTLLVDTTYSMREELDVIRANIGSVVNTLNSSQVEEYVLLTFNDPDIGTPISSSSPQKLINSLRTLTLSGGHDCPENSMAGILKALEVSKPKSFIFVFTDAYAKDKSKFSYIQNMCQRTSSQVTIFLSGLCPPSEVDGEGDVNVYYKVAKSCSGNLFKIDPLNLRQAFNFIKEITKVDWNDLSISDFFERSKTIKFSVDSFTSNVMITTYGVYPMMQIKDSNDKFPDTEKIMDSLHSVVVRLVNPSAGEYKVDIRSQGSTHCTVYKRNESPFRLGFSTRRVVNFEETSSKPIPGWTSYILIAGELPSVIAGIAINFADSVKTLEVEEIEEKKMYVASTLFPSSKTFRIVITSRDPWTDKTSSSTTSPITPQETVLNMAWTVPTIKMINPGARTIDFGNKETIACKVIGYPKTTIEWHDDSGNLLTSEDVLLEIPDVYISYATIENINKNLTVYCKAKNPRGESTEDVQIFVHRNMVFEIIQTPRNETIEFDTEGKLYCEVNAYPEASTKWYHNGTSVELNDRIKIKNDEQVLIIKQMGSQDVGEYKCVVQNKFETHTFTATITVSGLEQPGIDKHITEMNLKPGDWSDLECSVTKGKPTPKVTWRFKPSNINYFTKLPEGAKSEDNTIKLRKVRTEHDGIFRCEASNELGLDYHDIAVKVQSLPVINRDQPESLTVKEGELVELTCNVEAVPVAKVHWEMIQDDVINAFDARHTTDDKHTHRFEALWKDSGTYNCVAENTFGKAEKAVRVNVLVAPYIQAPESKNITVRAGAFLDLGCNVLYGNPAPSTVWKFIARNFTTSVLSRGESTIALHLTNISPDHEGSYLCIAENIAGSDNIKIYISVQ